MDVIRYGLIRMGVYYGEYVKEVMDVRDDGEFVAYDDFATLQRERDGLREAMAHLAANSYDHHTPHMVCIPTDEWKIAEAMLDDTARGAGNGRGDGN